MDNFDLTAVLEMCGALDEVSPGPFGSERQREEARKIGAGQSGGFLGFSPAGLKLAAAQGLQPAEFDRDDP